jgi:DNA-binding MarR family transcriptional regulator
MHPDPYTPTRNRRALTPEQQRLADRLQERAERLMADAEEGMSIREAVEFAAVQLGIAR